MTTTYYALDSSPHSGKPYELYAFEGYEKTYYYTTKGDDVVFNGQTYKAVQIQRGALTIGDLNSNSSSLVVSIDIASEIAKDSVGLISRPALNLTIFRMQRGATGYKKIVAGITAAYEFKVKEQICAITVKTKQQVELARNIAPIYFQNACNNEFGDVRCKFDVLSVQSPITVLEVNEARTLITIAEIHIPGEFEAGYIFIENQARRIIANDASTIKIAYPFTGEIPSIVFIRRGCKKDYDSCKAYNNTENYTGIRFIPSTNISQSPLNQIIANFEATKKDDLITQGKAKPLGSDTSNNVKKPPSNWSVSVNNVPSTYVPYPDYTITYGKYPPK